MTPPLGAALIKHVGAPALTAMKTAILITGLSLIGVAFLCYGVQSELSRWMSEGAAAIVIGAALLAAVFAMLAQKSAAKEEEDATPLMPSVDSSASLLVSSKLNELARTAFIHLSARRPMTTLAIAAIVGVSMLAMSRAEKAAMTP